MLKDAHGRIHDYLRISLTEKCNLRCTYCMPEEGVLLKPQVSYMTPEEVIDFAKFFVQNGVKKIRLTGGEPLVYKGFGQVLKEISQLGANLSLTTNGLLLHKFWDQLIEANISSINISLDTLKESRFKEITRRSGLDVVLSSINKAIELGLKVKINVVLMKGVNDEEIIDFVRMTFNQPISIRFIEFMPFDGNKWQWDKVIPSKEVMAAIAKEFDVRDIVPLDREKNFIAKDYRLFDALGTFGTISTMTDSFCGGCNRIRLTSDGHIKNCLFTGEETDLLTPLRKGEDLTELLHQSLLTKHLKNGGIDFRDPSTMHDHRSMISIGG
ncbi:MAG: GTP 3',8-cyclase MoaA [Flavobacteriales bacterium]|nr:GTP 3',8-cyclase MoaA [Flavobacteriales bacterium]